MDLEGNRRGIVLGNLSGATEGDHEDRYIIISCQAAGSIPGQSIRYMRWKK